MNPTKRGLTDSQLMVSPSEEQKYGNQSGEATTTMPATVAANTRARCERPPVDRGAVQDDVSVRIWRRVEQAHLGGIRLLEMPCNRSVCSRLRRTTAH
jgi:hypothetical protein